MLVHSTEKTEKKEKPLTAVFLLYKTKLMSPTNFSMLSRSAFKKRGANQGCYLGVQCQTDFRLILTYADTEHKKSRPSQ